MTIEHFSAEQWDTGSRRAARVDSAITADALRTGKLPGNSKDVKVRRKGPIQVGASLAAIAAFGLLVLFGNNCYKALSYKGHFDAGLRMLSQGNAERAQVEFTLATKFDPKSADGWYYLGQAEAARGSNGNALRDFASALAIRPDSAKYHLARAALCMKMQSWAGAIADCEAAVKTDPAFVDAYSVMAAAHNQLGEYPQAAEAAGKFLSQFQANDAYRADVLAKRGYAHDNLKDYDAAVADYDEAIKCDPGNPALYASRAVAYMHDQQWQSAIADCNKSLDLKPTNNPAAFKVRGIAHGKLSLQRNSLRDLDELVLLNESVDTHRIRGRQRLAVGDLLGTLQDFDYVLAAEPEDRHTTRQYIHAKRVLQANAPRTDVVADEEKRARMPNSNDLNKTSSELMKRGRQLFLNGDYEPSIAYFVTALRRNPRDLAARRSLADACVEAGRINAAVRQYGVVLALNPADDGTRTKLIRVLLNDKRADDAAKISAEGAQQNPDLYKRYNAFYQQSLALKRGTKTATM